MYGRKYLGIERSAFLVDEHGKIANAWYKVSPADTPKNLLAALRMTRCRSRPTSYRTGRRSCSSMSSPGSSRGPRPPARGR